MQRFFCLALILRQLTVQHRTETGKLLKEKMRNHHDVSVSQAYPETTHKPRILLTVKQFSDKNPAFTQGSIRNLIFLAEPRATTKGVINGNGLDKALLRIGRKVLIDESNFFEWVDDQQPIIHRRSMPATGGNQ